MVGRGLEDPKLQPRNMALELVIGDHEVNMNAGRQPAGT